MKDFKLLYKRYVKEIYNYLYYLTNDYSLAEELAQETFYQAFTSIHRFKGKSKVRTWLYQIAKHVYYKHLRKHSHYDQLHENDEKYSSIDSPQEVLEKKEDIALLYRSIKSLQEPYKQVVILRLFNELSFKEIGDILSESENWARVTYHRGKQIIGSDMKKGGK